VHDLPLLKDGVILKKRTGLPLVIDFHENYPEGMTSWSGWKKSFLINLKNRVLFSFKRWKKYEADYISKADAIIAVVEEMKEKFMREYNLKIPISVISNTEPKSFRDNNIDKLRMVARSKSGFTIAYIGGIDAIRGLDTVINAVPIMKEKIPGLIVNIIGGGSEAVFLKLRTQVKQLGLENTVYIPGPIPFEKVFNATHSADVCLIPHVKNEHTDHTIPHKLFQYMLTGKPIVVSNCKPLERIIAETACGLVFESGNANSFAEKIIELYANPDLRTTMGYNGVKATYEGRYNWDESGLDLVALYNGLLV
jgi:glycosyltransferase involved in cell wall biosynthesis